MQIGRAEARRAALSLARCAADHQRVEYGSAGAQVMSESQ
jgi:hypothetical protein